jgi:uncharacterized damage-inducible protein DinB
MTLHEIKLLHAYNSWADQRIFDALEMLTNEQYQKDMKTSHGGVHGALTHIVGAEKIWLSRWVGRPDAAILKSTDVSSLPELKKIWEKVGYETAKFLGGLTDKKLQETFSITTSKGETYTHVYWHAIQHMVNHSTYHRGQIVAMLRQLGVQPPRTDLILFYRESEKLR